MNIATAFSALSDPTRLAIVTRLAERGEADVMDLVSDFPISQPAVSRHVKVLEQTGWITRRREGTRRPVRLAPGRLDEIIVWSGRLRTALQANYARLDDILAEEDEII